MTTSADALQPPPQLAGATRLGALALLRGAAEGDPVRAGPHLAILEPGHPERLVPIAGELTIGRSVSAAVRLSDPAASRLHLRLRAAADGVAAEDLGSRNGLMVNGRTARGAQPLRHGDRLTLGQTVIRFADPLEPCDQELSLERPALASAGGRGRAGRWWIPACAVLLALGSLALLLLGG